jgi:molybdenum cofactor biosynthesis protein B
VVGDWAALARRADTRRNAGAGPRPRFLGGLVHRRPEVVLSASSHHGGHGNTAAPGTKGPRPYNCRKGHLDHKAASPAIARCYILTISDTRTEATDTSGRAIFDLLFAGGHQVAGRRIVPDEPLVVRQVIEEQVANPDVQVVIATGGTGISSRDRTFETIDVMLDKRLDGFGELFRMLSYQEIGSAAMLSRATAGLCRGTVLFSLPGSEQAVRLGMTKLILPELGHLVREAGR